MVKQFTNQSTPSFRVQFFETQCIGRRGAASDRNLTPWAAPAGWQGAAALCALCPALRLPPP